MDLYRACKRARVLEPSLVEELRKELEEVKPLKAVLNAEFIASNQADRADNVFAGTNLECVEQLRRDMQAMKERCEKVVVLWTANTEQMAENIETVEELERRIAQNEPLPASVLYCYSAVQEGLVYLNGSPQNTFHPALLSLAKQHRAFLGGSDFKSGQTRLKTCLGDFLIGSGLKLAAVVSYNHLGNNDGKNLQEDKCFQSKRISKASVLEDAILSNPVLYPQGNDIDHEVVIKYVPFVGDSKRALDEYSSLIFMNGVHTIASYNVCEDSLLAVPLMIDLVILAEFCTRVQIDGDNLGPVLSYLSFFFKAPSTNHQEYVVNSFARQRATLTNFLKLTAGYMPDDSSLLGFKF